MIKLCSHFPFSLIFSDSVNEIHPYSLYRKKVIAAVFKLSEAIDVRSLDSFSRKKNTMISPSQAKQKKPTCVNACALILYAVLYVVKRCTMQNRGITLKQALFLFDTLSFNDTFENLTIDF